MTQRNSICCSHCVFFSCSRWEWSCHHTSSVTNTFRLKHMIIGDMRISMDNVSPFDTCWSRRAALLRGSCRASAAALLLSPRLQAPGLQAWVISARSLIILAEFNQDEAMCWRCILVDIALFIFFFLAWILTTTGRRIQRLRLIIWGYTHRKRDDVSSRLQLLPRAS